jgi:late competence protein required for DNA uptake (superfamily II DNA/RNA helicase)
MFRFGLCVHSGGFNEIPLSVQKRGVQDALFLACGDLPYLQERAVMAIEAKWECDRCGEIHDDEYDAIDCCRPIVNKVYLCPECTDVHETKQAAIDCCDSEEDEDSASSLIIPQGDLPVTEYVRKFEALNNLMPSTMEEETA